MRHLTAPALAVLSLAALTVSGCQERANMRELPDRGGHAYRTGGAERPLSFARTPYADEQFYTVKAGDNLKKLSQTYGVPEGWFIRRNDLQTHELKAGDNIIVPKTGK
jgi:hypothetical protein